MPLTCVVFGCNSKQMAKKGVAKACSKEKM